MAERANKRESDRAQARKQVADGVKKWPVGLQTNLARIRDLADREWNFERFYTSVQQFAGTAVTREILRDFLRSESIVLKGRPKASGKVM